jgi:hypothetical protein
VALKEVAEDITVYNILDDLALRAWTYRMYRRLPHEWYIQCRYFTAFSTKMNDSIKDLTDTLCQRLVDRTIEEEPCEAGTTKEETCEAGTSREEKNSGTDRPRR